VREREQLAKIRDAIVNRKIDLADGDLGLVDAETFLDKILVMSEPHRNVTPEILVAEYRRRHPAQFED